MVKVCREDLRENEKLLLQSAMLYASMEERRAAS
jgi:hypothetical protein